MPILSRLASDVQLMFRRPPRQQYAALCYRMTSDDRVEILLQTSRDTGRWVIPKGWPMADKGPHEVAAQEAYEEAGVRGNVDKTSIGCFLYRKGMKDGFTVDCKVQVYALEVTEIAKKFKEKGERRAEWVSCEEAANRVHEPMLKLLMLGFETELRQRKG